MHFRPKKVQKTCASEELAALMTDNKPKRSKEDLRIRAILRVKRSVVEMIERCEKIKSTFMQLMEMREGGKRLVIDNLWLSKRENWRMMLKYSLWLGQGTTQTGVYLLSLNGSLTVRGHSVQRT